MIKIIYKILPNWFKNKWLRKAQNFLNRELPPAHTVMPIIHLKPHHIQNTKLLANRNELLKALPKGGICAELGVDTGGFSSSIFSIVHPNKLYLIDAWNSERYSESKMAEVENKFVEEIRSGQIELIRGLSTEVVNSFQNNYFDWIYIDTDHSYETTARELELYRQKVKEDGLICGHDYIVGNWNAHIRYGVMEAVSEFCNLYNWELIYLTTEMDIKPSFAIRKIKS
ncbi:MAG: class I SAM-dependent methyltransferase [Saprospiraceae bacterium]|nr:class I SAM-dependent methyltransferase [Saprospiraceae bacterium]